MIRYECPHCKATLESEDSTACETRNCPECGTTIRVPLSAAQKIALVTLGITLDDGQANAEPNAQRERLQEEERRWTQPSFASSIAWIVGLTILGGLVTPVLVYVLGIALFSGTPWDFGGQRGLLLFAWARFVAPLAGAGYWVTLGLYIRGRCASRYRQALSWTLVVVGYVALVFALVMAVGYVSRPRRL